jgi:hypothetical protein
MRGPAAPVADRPKQVRAALAERPHPVVVALEPAREQQETTARVAVVQRAAALVEAAARTTVAQAPAAKEAR